jgi:hypothetical protein
MHLPPSKKERERQILKGVVDKAKPKTNKGGQMGPFDPYAKTMVPVPPYITTGSPTPSDSTTINYSRKENGDALAKAAVKKYSQFDRSPRHKERANAMVGKINDEKNLTKSYK